MTSRAGRATHDRGRRNPRQLLVATPSGTPSTIVLSLHGSTSTPERQVRLSRMGPLAEQGAVVAFPQGSIPSRAGWEWDLHGDVAFLDSVVDYLRETCGAPAVPLCVSGMSGGARMASRVASSGRDPVPSWERWRAAHASGRTARPSRAGRRLPRSARQDQSLRRRFDGTLARECARRCIRLGPSQRPFPRTRTH